MKTESKEKTTIAQLVARLRELPQNATVENFMIVFRDRNGELNKIECK